jgi:predicted Rossmann fold flavoprotein
MEETEVLILGAGAAGLMCAATAGQRGRKVLLLDHATKPGEKIRISGGGRCNFTNIHCSPANFLSQNPHFAKSALSRYQPADFIKLVEKHGISYHEKTLGQLFCDGSSQQIIDLLLAECALGHVQLWLDTKVTTISRSEDGSYLVTTSRGPVKAGTLVIATGGPSIPKMGSSGFGYQVAQQFGLPVIPPRAALVPLTFAPELLAETQPLSGLSVPLAEISAQDGTAFQEGLLFTHRGLSGPSILQISSYWQPGQSISINLLPQEKLLDALKLARRDKPKQLLHNVLADWLPARLAELMAEKSEHDVRMADLSDAKLEAIAAQVQGWQVTPAGSEGYRTAEVTLGGVDTRALSSKTFMANDVPGLYFIGEVVDVTGHLGGFNFQWAWASGYCCGQTV